MSSKIQSRKTSKQDRAAKLSAAAFKAHVTRCAMALKRARNSKVRAEIIARQKALQAKLSQIAA